MAQALTLGVTLLFQTVAFGVALAATAHGGKVHSSFCYCLECILLQSLLVSDFSSLFFVTFLERGKVDLLWEWSQTWRCQDIWCAYVSSVLVDTIQLLSPTYYELPK